MIQQCFLFHIRLFDDNLKEVDKGIAKTVALFKGLFPDEKTAFIFTSDHGMSNKGKRITSYPDKAMNRLDAISEMTIIFGKLPGK